MPEQEEYKNFNEYDEAAKPAAEEKTEEKVEVKETPKAAPSDKNENTDTFSPMGIISCALALMGCCGYGLPSIVAVILGAIGVKRNKKDVAAKIGLIAGILIVVFWIATIIRIATDPELRKELLDQMNDLYNTSGSDIAKEVAARLFHK